MNSIQPIPIIYQDSEIVIINKRAGLAVQGGAGIVHSVDTDLAAELGQKIYLVHRLDRETGGLLICAKSSAAAAKWTRRTGEKSVVKEYKALVTGVPRKKSGRLNFEIDDRGVKKRAETFYELEKVFPAAEDSLVPDLSLLRLRLGTGRMHQIRIHLAKAGYPICGDDRHGNFKMNKILKKEMGIKRLCLCAFRLTLPLADGLRIFEIPVDFE